MDILDSEKKRHDNFQMQRKISKKSPSAITNELMIELSKTPINIGEKDKKLTFEVNVKKNHDQGKDDGLSIISTRIGGISVTNFTLNRLKILFIKNGVDLVVDEFLREDKEFFRRVFLVIYRYSYVDPYYNRQPYMASKYFKAIYNTFGRLDLESFAASFNATVPKFCSLFKDVEGKFGSVGNFFDYKFTKDDVVIQVNPPYIGEITSASVDKCVNTLRVEHNVERYFILLTDPTWDDVIEKFDKSEFIVWQNKPKGVMISYVNPLTGKPYEWRMPLVTILSNVKKFNFPLKFLEQAFQ